MGAITFKKTNGNLGRKAPSVDGVSMMVMNGVAITGGAQLNQIYKIEKLADAESLGITQAYDLAEKVLVWHEIFWFYLMAPKGTKLYIYLVAQTVTLADMVDVGSSVNLKQVVNSTDDIIRLLGVVRNPATGYTPVITTGINAEVLAAIPKAHELAELMFDWKRPLSSVIIEGQDLSGSYSSLVSLRGLASENYTVSVSLAQDKQVANLDSLFAKHASVGIVLGTAAYAAVNECVGWTGKFPISKEGQDPFSALSLSDGTLASDLTPDDITDLDICGFIFGRKYPNQVLAYLNDSHTACKITNDFAYIENNRTIDKAIILIDAIVFPTLNGPEVIDGTTGKLLPESVTSYEQLVLKSLDPMFTAREISEATVTIDPDQDLISSSEWNVELDVVPTGTKRKINFTVGLANPFNN